MLQACGQAVGIDGDASVGSDLSIPIQDALDRLAQLGPRPDYRTMPVPEDQPGDPDRLPAGLRPFRDPSPGSALATAIALAAVFLGFFGGVYFDRRRRLGRARRTPSGGPGTGPGTGLGTARGTT